MSLRLSVDRLVDNRVSHRYADPDLEMPRTENMVAHLDSALLKEDVDTVTETNTLGHKVIAVKAWPDVRGTATFNGLAGVPVSARPLYRPKAASLVRPMSTDLRSDATSAAVVQFTGDTVWKTGGTLTILGTVEMPAGGAGGAGGRGGAAANGVSFFLAIRVVVTGKEQVIISGPSVSLRVTKEGWWRWGNSNNGAEQVIAPEEASAGDWQIISALIHPSNGTSLYVDGRLVGRHVGSYDGSSGGTLLVLSGTYNLMRGGVYGDLAEMIAYSSGDANAVNVVALNAHLKTKWLPPLRYQLSSVELVGGDTVGSDATVPCFFLGDVTCNSDDDLSGTYPVMVLAKFRLLFTLPVRLKLQLPLLALDFDCCVETNIGGAEVTSLLFDSTSTRPHEVMVKIEARNVPLLRDALQWMTEGVRLSVCLTSLKCALLYFYFYGFRCFSYRVLVTRN